MIRLGKLAPELMNRAVRAVAAAAELPTLGPWYSIQNMAGDSDGTAQLEIYGEVGFFGVTAAQFNEDLRSITAKRVDMRVNSPGGDVFDAIAIYNLIRSHPAHFTARVDGLAASAASVIIQAADERVMMPHSQQMIHKAWAMTIGNADDHAETVDLLNRQDEIIAGIYHERTKGGQRTLEKIKSAMAAETWFTDEEAVAFKIADRVEKAAWQSDPPEEDEDDAGPEPEPDEEPVEDDPATDDVRDDHATMHDNWADMLRIAIDELDDLEAALT